MLVIGDGVGGTQSPCDIHSAGMVDSCLEAQTLSMVPSSTTYWLCVLE